MNALNTFSKSSDNTALEARAVVIERFERLHDVEEDVDSAALAGIVALVARDAALNPRSYAIQTLVPEGGE